MWAGGQGFLCFLPPPAAMDPNQFLVSKVVAASAALLSWDYLCTLDTEINHVWSRPFSISSVIFFLNRYLPFIDTFLSLTLKSSVNSPERCHMNFKAVTWFLVFGIILAEVIMMLRTYAIWGCERKVAIFFIGLSVVTFVPAIVVAQLELSSLIYVESPYPGCYLSHSSPIIIVAYILLAMCESVIAIMMGIKAFQHLPHSHSRWVESLYKNGLLYYLCLLAVSLGNVIVPIANSHLANMLATPQRVLHSILCNRLLFLILSSRYASITPDDASTFGVDENVGTHLSFVHSAPEPISNMQSCELRSYSATSETTTLGQDDFKIDEEIV
ncbi:hypothetical protein C8J56DRAFT_974328 [Mycena floridula]|nr:hypothetical protein C8J56DRAFT_974328 [Mycena floridula]